MFRTNRVKISTFVLAGLTGIAMVSSCGLPNGKKRSRTPNRSEFSAPADITKSFAVKEVIDSSAEAGGKEYVIGLDSNSLDKEFLLRANAIIGLNSTAFLPSFNGLKSRVVAFKRQGSSLFMLEASKGHRYYTSIPLEVILAEFNILSEDARHIYFDFNKGMSKLYTFNGWYASDFSASTTDTLYSSQKVEHSYLTKAELRQDNQLIITQVAQLAGEGKTIPAQIAYRLEPYQVNENFKATKTGSFDKMGFFQVSPTIDEQGGQQTLAAKFDHSKGISFAVSANTPDDYKQAVKEGIEYWNKIFGSQIVHAIDAPEGTSAPDYDYNVVQWVDWKDAGFAYADAQMDPRTGETLNAQVFMTSAFAVSGRRAAADILRRISSNDGTAQSHSSYTHDFHRVSLKGFEQEALCFADLNNSFAQGISNLLQQNASDDQILALSKAYIRTVVAHEVGHTLGLRHNFAGSLAGNYGLNESDDVIQSILTTGNVPADKEVSSTVMDYIPFNFSAVLGTQILSKPLAYDQMAINYLYNDIEAKQSDSPLFCTDTHRGHFYDCNVFDVGSSMEEYARDALDEGLNRIPDSIARYFINYAKSPAVGNDALSLNDININAADLAKGILSARSFALAGLSTEQKSIAIYRQFESDSDLYIDRIQSAQNNELLSQVHALNGWANILGTIPTDYKNQIISKFNQIIESDAYRSGVGPGGSYAFTDSEIAQMQNTFALFAEKLANALLTAEVESFSELKNISDSDVSYEFLDYLSKEVSRILNATEGSITVEVDLPKEAESTDAVKETLVLPIYKYSATSRKATIGLLSSDRGVASDWGINEKKAVSDAYKESLNNAIGGRDITTTSALGQPREFAQWLIENKKVISE
ncbi:MAG: zinc-dependent metalloprotease [Bdellovibrionota bacterium]